MADLIQTVKDWAESEWSPVLSNTADNKAALISKILTTPGSDDPFSTGARNDIFGLPLRYNEISDPNKRVYAQSILRDLPLISIIPGNPQFIDITKDPNLNSEVGLIRSLVKGTIDRDGNVNSTTISNWLSKAKGSDDTTNIRYYNFRSDYSSYFKYVQVMLNTLFIKMKLGKYFDFGAAFPKKFGERSALAFFYDVNATSISESADNDFGASQLDGMAKQGGQIAREIRFVLGKNVTPDAMAKFNADDRNTKNGKVDDKVEEMSALGSLFDNLKRQGKDVSSVMYNGANIMYPEVWQDSRFTRSYSLGFKFSSPYGDPMSIFQFIYVPFVCLLALCLPRQDSVMGYGSPFIIKADIPGNFSIDMGVVSSMTYKKADDNAWSKDGLPLELTVTLQCKDLYPAMMMSNSFQTLIANVGLLTYLENLAGLTITESKAVGDITSFLSDKVSNIVQAPKRLINNVNDIWTDWSGSRDLSISILNKLGR
jgi:hypothetical protein